MLNNEEAKRSVIWFLWKQGKRQAEIIRELQATYGECAPSKTMVNKWVQRFEDGWETVEDLPRSGRPATTVNGSNIELVRRALDVDRRATVRELATSIGISSTAIHSILTVELGMSRVVARWVPKLLTDQQQRERVQVCQQLLQAHRSEPNFLDRIVTGDESWFHYSEPESKMQSSVWKASHEPTPVKALTAPSAGKQMATVFWDKEGILLIEWLPRGATINSEYYIQVLKKLRDAIKTQRRGKLSRGILLQHDNARPHTSQATMAAISDLGFEVLPHPPYSPDLAPSDYWLFGEMKKPLRGHQYSSLQALASAVSQWVRGSPADFYAAGIEKLPERWHKCISLMGAYIEKQE
jgi:histone-lysine N-methyltransferase SETMAR